MVTKESGKDGLCQACGFPRTEGDRVVGEREATFVQYVEVTDPLDVVEMYLGCICEHLCQG